MDSCILIPVHNRLPVTRRCLEILSAQRVLDWASVIVIDDGSSDGTSEWIRGHWPQVRVLAGGGSLWWGGAMRLGMTKVPPSAKTFFWLNDDCHPAPGVLWRMHQFALESGQVAVAQAITPRGFVYGGWRKTLRGLAYVPKDSSPIQPIDSFGGNCVAFPAFVLGTVGNLDPVLFHNYADADYALRLGEKGVVRALLADARCESEHNDIAFLGSWTEGTLSFAEFWRGMKSPKSMFFWPSRRHFFVKHWGPLRGFLIAALPYARFFGMWLFSALLGRKRLLVIREAYRKVFKVGQPAGKS